MLNKTFKEIADALMKAGISPQLVFVHMQIGTGEAFTAVTLLDVEGNLRYFRIMPDGMVVPVISITRETQYWPGQKKNSTLTDEQETKVIKDKPVLALAGYAPGDSIRQCTECKATFTGSKDAYNCVPCATEIDYKARQQQK